MNLPYLKFQLAKLFASFPLIAYPGESPETWLESIERRAMAGEVLAEEAHGDLTGFHPSDAAALGVAVWVNESALEHNVHAGLPSHLGPSDYGKARCMGQVHWWRGNTLLTRDEWLALVGVTQEATRRCARATLSYLWHHAQRCLRRDVPASKRWDDPLTPRESALVFAAYGSGSCTSPKRSTMRRVYWFRRVKKEMRR